MRFYAAVAALLLLAIPAAARAQTAPAQPPAALSTLMEDWSAAADAQRHVAQSLSAYIKDQQGQIADLQAKLVAAQKAKPAAPVLRKSPIPDGAKN